MSKKAARAKKKEESRKRSERLHKKKNPRAYETMKKSWKRALSMQKLRAKAKAEAESEDGNAALLKNLM